MKQLLKRITPSVVLRLRSSRRNQALLNQLPPAPFDAGAIGRLADIDLRRIFRDHDPDKDWPAVESEILGLSMSKQAGAVNPGDQRALYHLVYGLRPQSVLEIGTHLGGSTVAIACALRQLKKRDATFTSRLLTVDIRDVNDPESGPWKRLGSRYPPRTMVEMLGCEEFVEFRSGTSLSHFASSDEAYDLIFLDGDHAAITVYQEIVAAARHLTRGAYILLHDYFPQMKPLWSNGVVSPGPYLAVRRLQDEGAPIRVAPFGDLPWPTKLNSHASSLALLARG